MQVKGEEASVSVRLISLEGKKSKYNGIRHLGVMR